MQEDQLIQKMKKQTKGEDDENEDEDEEAEDNVEERAEAEEEIKKRIFSAKQFRRFQAAALSVRALYSIFSL